MLGAVIVFVSMVITDALYAIYNRRSVSGHAHAAGMFAAGLAVTSAVVNIFYVANHWLVPAAALGAYVGTYFTVRHDHAKETHTPARAQDGGTTGR